MNKFRWVGRHKELNTIIINKDLTTEKVIIGDCLSFFNIQNRAEWGNCEFMSEDLCSEILDAEGNFIYENDILDIVGKVEFKKGCFIASGIPISLCASNRTILGNIYQN